MSSNNPNQDVTETTPSAVDRLDDAQRRELDNITASMAMERIDVSSDMQEIGALYLLGEITAAEKTERLDAIFRDEFTS